MLRINKYLNYSQYLNIIKNDFTSINNKSFISSSSLILSPKKNDKIQNNIIDTDIKSNQNFLKYKEIFENEDDFDFEEQEEEKQKEKKVNEKSEIKDKFLEKEEEQFKVLEENNNNNNNNNNNRELSEWENEDDYNKKMERYYYGKEKEKEEEEEEEEEEHFNGKIGIEQNQRLDHNDNFEFEIENEKTYTSLPNIYQKFHGRTRLFYESDTKNFGKNSIFFKPYLSILSEAKKITFPSQILKKNLLLLEDIKLTSLFSFEKRQSQLFLFSFISIVLELKSLNDWLKIDKVFFKKYLLDRVLLNYDKSLEKCLLTLYPNHGWRFTTPRQNLNPDVFKYTKIKCLKENGYLNDEKIEIIKNNDEELENLISSIPTTTLQLIFPSFIYIKYKIPRSKILNDQLLKRHLHYNYSEKSKEYLSLEYKERKFGSEEEDFSETENKSDIRAEEREENNKRYFKMLYYTPETCKFSKEIYDVDFNEVNPYSNHLHNSGGMSKGVQYNEHRDIYLRIKSFDPTIKTWKFKRLKKYQIKIHLVYFIQEVEKRYNIKQPSDWYDLKYDSWFEENKPPIHYHEQLFLSLNGKRYPSNFNFSLDRFKDKELVDNLFLSKERLHVRQLIWKEVRDRFGNDATLDDWYRLSEGDIPKETLKEIQSFSKNTLNRLEGYARFSYPYHNWVSNRFLFISSSFSNYSVEYYIDSLFKERNESLKSASQSTTSVSKSKSKSKSKSPKFPTINSLEDFYTLQLEVFTYFRNFSLYWALQKRFPLNDLLLFKFTQFRKFEFKNANKDFLYYHSELFYQHLVSTENIEHPLDFIHLYLNNPNGLSSSKTFLQFGLPSLLQNYFGLNIPEIEPNNLDKFKILEIYNIYLNKINNNNNNGNNINMEDILNLPFSKILNKKN